MTSRRDPIQTAPVGQPVAISALARLLLKVRSRPALRVVVDEQRVAERREAEAQP
jgi:hypothetical protein